MYVYMCVQYIILIKYEIICFLEVLSDSLFVFHSFYFSFVSITPLPLQFKPFHIILFPRSYHLYLIPLQIIPPPPRVSSYCLDFCAYSIQVFPILGKIQGTINCRKNFIPKNEAPSNDLYTKNNGLIFQVVFINVYTQPFPCNKIHTKKTITLKMGEGIQGIQEDQAGRKTDKIELHIMITSLIA